MQPSKLYPRDFVNYINSPLSPFEAYQVLLEKCGGKTITDLFKAVNHLVNQEVIPDELERIRVGLLYMDVNVPEIVDKECYKVVRSVQKVVLDHWIINPVESYQYKLREIAKGIEHKMCLFLDESYKDEQALKKKVIAQIEQIKKERVTDHPNIGILLENVEFCKSASAMIAMQSSNGKGERNQLIGSLVKDFKELIAAYGFHIGSKLEGLDTPFVGGDAELDLIEAVLIAGVKNLHLLIKHMEKIPNEGGEQLSGEEEFYYMNISYAVMQLTGEQFG